MMSRTCVFETSSTPSSIASSSVASTPRSRNSARKSAIPCLVLTSSARPRNSLDHNPDTPVSLLGVSSADMDGDYVEDRGGRLQLVSRATHKDRGNRDLRGS